MNQQVIVLNDRTRFGKETGAGLMRNRCAFTSRDMGYDWLEAFTYAIVMGWDDGTEYPEDGDAMAEVSEKFEWDADLITFLKDAHQRFKQLPGKREGAPDAHE